MIVFLQNEYCKRDDFDKVWNCQFSILYSIKPHPTSYGVYISQLIRFARVSSRFHDFKTHNEELTQKRNFSNQAISIINFAQLSF